MADIFITSDEHFGHENIIEFCQRPFKSVEEQTETIIERFNKKVPNNPNITTIHVGDMFWQTMTTEEALAILSRLHGGHAFIYGNHDELIEKSPSLRERFKWIVGRNKESGSRIIHWNKHEITLNHYAMHVWNRSHKGSWMLFGHSHGELQVRGKSFDIGVDSHNFEPWSLEEIAAEMEKRPQGHVIHPDKVWPGKGPEVLRNTNAGSEIEIPQRFKIEMMIEPTNWVRSEDYPFTYTEPDADYAIERGLRIGIRYRKVEVPCSFK